METTSLSNILLLMQAQNTELATLVTRLAYLEIGAACFMVVGFIYIAVLSHRSSAHSHAIAAMVAEVLHRTPER